jgi:hypothetical protein
MKRMPRSMMTAMLSAAAVTAPFVSGKATRDALFLTSLDYTALPAMLIATSVFSILLVFLNARGARRIAPAILVPALFVGSGVLFILEWFLRSTSPRPPPSSSLPCPAPDPLASGSGSSRASVSTLEPPRSDSARLRVPERWAERPRRRESRRMFGALHAVAAGGAGLVGGVVVRRLALAAEQRAPLS